MKKYSLLLFIGFFYLGLSDAKAAAIYNDRIAIQGYLKSGTTALNDLAGFPMKFVIKKNSTIVWCQTSATAVVVADGVFSQVLTGISNCSALTNSLDESIFVHAASSDTFSIDVVVDVLKNGFAGADDASFAGIDLVPTPLALSAKHAMTASEVSGVVSVANGGTAATSAIDARTNLGLGSISVLNLSGSASDVLLGNGVFGAPAVPALSGDVSGTTSVTSVDKIKGRAVSATTPTNGQVLTWSTGTSSWVPQTSSAAPVSSVAGKTGVVTLVSADITNTASANTPSVIVSRDSSGNFSAGTITANLTGNATNITGIASVANGGTGAATAAAARTSLGAAASGANTDITSITGAARQASVVIAPTTAGTTSAYTITNSPALASLATGQTIEVAFNAVNAASATLNVDGLGAKSIFSQFTGAAVAAGDLPTGIAIKLYYNGTQWVAEIPQRYFSASVNCGASVVAGSFVVCPNLAATNINAGDMVACAPAADPATTAGQLAWSAFATAGNISIRLSCNNGASACPLTTRTWKCAVQK